MFNIRDFDLNLLLIFEAVYSQRNISAAARQLDMSQPAVSNALARLRKKLDDPLFMRDGNGVAPTAKADGMILPVQQALTLLNTGIGEPEAFDPTSSERLFRMLVADPMEPLILPGLVRTIQDQGKIVLELLPPQSTPIEEALRQGALDIAIFLQPKRDPELECEPLCPLDIVIIARKGHPGLKNNNAGELVSNCGHVTLNLRPAALANSERIHLWQRVTRRDVCVVSKLSSMPPLVAETDLIGFVPRAYAEKVAPIFNLEVIDTPAKMGDQQMFMIWHKRMDRDAGHVWLRDTIRATLK